MESRTDGIRFGIFQAPYHPTNGNPTLQLRRDIDLAVHADHLGFDEYWVGEHHSTGIETVPAPDLLIAAAVEHTKRIRFGTGVFSLPYHHPLIVADRILQLDHQSQGRVILGVGPGKLPLDARMMGIDPVRSRQMQAESLDAIMALLTGETVSARTDWFTLEDARIQLLPTRPEGLEVAVASTVSPSGSILAGRHGVSLLSLAAGDPAGFEALERNWTVYTTEAAAHGHVPERAGWRVVTPMFLAETREEAERAIRRRVLHHVRYLERMNDTRFDWGRDEDSAIERLRGEGWPSFGAAVIGTPEDAIASIERLVEKTGGFGSYLILHYDIADWAATQRSYELFASEVIPHFRRANRNRVASLEYAREHSADLMGARAEGMRKSTLDYYGPDAEVHIR